VDNNLDKKKKPFCFRLSKEKFREFLGFSAEVKLEWLEEVKKFVNEFVSPEKRKRGEWSSSTEPGLKRQTKKGGLLYEAKKPLQPD
jgi:hypothetical protein